MHDISHMISYSVNLIEMTSKRSSISKIKKLGKKPVKSDQFLVEDSFIRCFNEQCFTNNVQPVPSFARLSDTNKESSVLADICVIYNEDQSVDTLLCKNFKVTGAVLSALQGTLAIYSTLTTLKLEFCNMRFEEIYLLQTILSNNPSIKEVSVNGNSTAKNSLYLLLQSNSVQILSLKFCEITKTGMSRLSEELCSEETNCPLLHLNLSSNNLFDECMPEVAQILRVNRQLISLNLADNKISDEGCKVLFTPLKKFALHFAEIQERRRRRFRYFRERIALMKESNILNLYLYKNHSLNPVNVVKETTSKSSRHHSVSSRKSKDSAKSFGSFGNPKKHETSESNMTTDKGAYMMKQINDKLETDDHPFVKDSWEEDKEIFCRGNLKLLHLNISYNKITNEGLNVILDVLKYQTEHCTENEKGLVKLVLQGNQFDTSCSEYKQIKKLLYVQHGKRRSKTSSLLKESVSSFSKKARPLSQRSLM